jgi:N-acetylglucosaminyldiphosphoundecaprenol N-acetyl-beta-D-mannosaminyltransferase
VIDRGKFNLLGVQISAVDYATAVEKVTDAARKQLPFGVSALAVHGVMTGVMDREHRHRLNSLELLVPDGQPVRWGLNWLHGTKLAERVYGPNLMLEICRAAESQGLRICLFGGSAELLEKLSGNLLRQFPNLQIVSKIPSKFRRLEPGEKAALVEQIQSSNAQITFCGLGCPRQETWAYEFKNSLSMPVIAVGAAFNFHAGLLPQAPGWMQHSGLEWFYRLTREPLRLWKRYLLLNPYYCFLFACQYLGLRRFDPANTQAPQGEVLYG